MATGGREAREGGGTAGEAALHLVAAQGAGWLRRRRGAVAAAVLLVVGGTLAVQVAARRRAATATAAAAEFLAGLHAATQGVIDPPADAEGEGEGEAPAAAGGRPHFASEDARWRAAQGHFAAATAQVGQRGVGAAATLMEGEALSHLGEHEAAMGRFATLASVLPPASPLYFLAVSRLAQAREARGELEAALAALDGLAGRPGQFYADYAEADVARILAARGDRDGARARLEHLEQAFPTSGLRDEVPARLAALAAMPAAEAPAGATPATP